MNSLLESELCVRLALALGHFVRQGALIAVVAASIAALLRRAAAKTRYAVWLTALAAMAAVPVITFGVATGGTGSGLQISVFDYVPTHGADQRDASPTDSTLIPKQKLKFEDLTPSPDVSKSVRVRRLGAHRF